MHGLICGIRSLLRKYPTHFIRSTFLFCVCFLLSIINIPFKTKFCKENKRKENERDLNIFVRHNPKIIWINFFLVIAMIHSFGWVLCLCIHGIIVTDQTWSYRRPFRYFHHKNRNATDTFLCLFLCVFLCLSFPLTCFVHWFFFIRSIKELLLLVEWCNLHLLTNNVLSNHFYFLQSSTHFGTSEKNLFIDRKKFNSKN